jgi:protease secretion system outer membrane protein
MGTSNAFALTLIESYNLALEHDPIFRASIKERDVNNASLMIGRSAILPKLSAGSNVGTNRLTNTYSGAASQTFDGYPSSNNYIQVLQPLFDLGSLAKYRQGLYQKDYGDHKFRADTFDLLMRVTTAYLDVLYSSDQLNYLIAENKAYQEQMQFTEKGAKLGETSKIDFLEAKSAYENSSAQILEARQQAEDSKRKFGILIGAPEAENLKLNPLTGKFPFIADLPTSYEQLKNLAIENNPDLRAAQIKTSIAKEEINKANANFLPQVSGIVSWSRQNSFSVNTVNLISNQTMGGIQAAWPIFSSGETLGQSRQAIAQYEKSTEEFEGLQLNTLSELKKVFDQTSLYQKKIQILESSLLSAKEAQKAMGMGVLAGIKTNLDVLLATKNVFNINKEIARAKYSYILAWLRAKQLAGTIEILDLERCSALYFANK